jgi:outer membrane autotransporter protein
VGGLGGYSRAGADTDARGRAHTDSYHLGLYAGTQWDATALRLGAAYARHKIDTRRDVAFEGFADRPAANYHGRTAQVFGEVGHRVDLGDVALEPFAGLAHVQLRSGAFRERGGAAALQGDGDKLATTFTTLGVRASAQLGDKTRLRGMLGWRHAFGDTAPESRHAFAGTLVSFSATGVPLAKNVAVLEAGIDTELAPGLTLGAAYAGQFGNGLRDHGFKVDLRWKF